jgi:hypothetical protein
LSGPRGEINHTVTGTVGGRLWVMNLRALRSAGLTVLLLAPLLATSQAATQQAPAAGAACGIVPWTGTCSCDIPSRSVGFARFAALLRASGGPAAEARLRAERQSCHLPPR